MGQFSIKWAEVNTQINDEKNWVAELSNIEEDIRSVKNNLRWKVAAEAGIKSRLAKALDRAEDCRKGMNNCQKALERCVEKYRSTEGRICEKGTVDIKELLWSIAKNFGLVGTAASGINTLITGDGIEKLGGLSDFLTIIGDWAKNHWAVSDQKSLKELLFGIGKSAKSVSWSEAAWKSITDSLDDFAFQSGNIGKNIKAATAWAGVAISGALNWAENVDEFGGESGWTEAVKNDRFWGETIIETGTDVALGIAGGAVAAGAIAALGVSAPAVVVGAVGAGVVWGVNEVCEHVTGKDVGECVADGCYAVAEWGSDFLQSAATNVKSFFSGMKNDSLSRFAFV